MMMFSPGARIVTTSSGELGEELGEIPDHYIRPSKDKKRLIQTGYLDLLYFEHRQGRAFWYGQFGMLCIFFSGIIWASREHLGVALAVLSIGGAYAWFRNQKISNEFEKHKDVIREELRKLGVGISHDQLTEVTLSNSAWGKLNGHTSSSLGIVTPVIKKNGMIDPFNQYVFDIFRDEIYRQPGS